MASLTQAEADELYPEHAKLKAAGAKKDAVEEFLHWLTDESKYSLVHDSGFESLESPALVFDSEFATVMAEFLGIDEKVLEREKHNMLERLRGNEI